MLTLDLSAVRLSALLLAVDAAKNAKDADGGRSLYGPPNVPQGKNRFGQPKACGTKRKVSLPAWLKLPERLGRSDGRLAGRFAPSALHVLTISPRLFSSPRQAKNVIMTIPDGFGPASQAFARE